MANGLDVIPEVSTWYITGSYIDGAIQTFGRAGFEIVVIDPVGELAAYAFGLPPVWVSSTTSVEGWALRTVLRLSPCLPATITDCLNLADTLRRGRAQATDVPRPLARLRGLSFQAFGGAVPAEALLRTFRWIPVNGGNRHR